LLRLFAAETAENRRNKREIEGQRREIFRRGSRDTKIDLKTA